VSQPAPGCPWQHARWIVRGLSGRAGSATQETGVSALDHARLDWLYCVMYEMGQREAQGLQFARWPHRVATQVVRGLGNALPAVLVLN